MAHDVGMAWGQSDSYAGGDRGERERERTADRGQTRPPPPRDGTLLMTSALFGYPKNRCSKGGWRNLVPHRSVPNAEGEGK